MMESASENSKGLKTARSPRAVLGRPGSEGYLSVVVVVFEMEREAPRTLRSLSAGYQRGVSPEDYEVIVVDNGSAKPLDDDVLSSLGENFRYVRVQDPHCSPAAAVNLGVREAQGDRIGILIDGARLVTPGTIRHALSAMVLGEHIVVGTLGFHLGSEYQYQAVDKGYTPEFEDGLLDSIGWPDDGYRLFEIGVFAESSRRGWFQLPDESNCFFMHKGVFDRLGGFDERFDLPGGGWVNLEFWNRVCASVDLEVMLLLGEASFHQVHGGIATNCGPRELAERLRKWCAQYEEIRGEPFQSPEGAASVLGSITEPAARWVIESARLAMSGDPTQSRRSPSEEVEAIQQELERVKTLVEGFESSRSWRITQPFRVIAEALRSGLRRR